MAQIVLTVF